MRTHCPVHVTLLLFLGCALFVAFSSVRAEITATAVQVEGQAGYGTTQKGPWKKLEKAAELPLRSYLRTGADAKVVLRFPGEAVVTVHEYSLVYLHTMQGGDEDEQGGKSLIGLLVGKLWAKFKKNDTSSFSIYTPAAIAAVRGTEYFVESDPQTRNSTIGVWEGEVRVSAYQEPLREQTVDVPAGFQIEVLFNKPPDKQTMLKMEAAREREKQQFNEQLQGLGLASVLGGGAVEMARIEDQRVSDVRDELRGAIAEDRARKKMDEDFDKLQLAIARLYRDTQFLPGEGARKSSGAVTLRGLVENVDHAGQPLAEWKGPYIQSDFKDPYGNEYCVYHLKRGDRVMGFYLHSRGRDGVASSHDDNERLVTMGRLRALQRELE